MNQANFYVQYHHDQTIVGIEVDGEFFPDEGIYTVLGRPVLYDRAYLLDYYGSHVVPENQYREATSEEISRGVFWTNRLIDTPREIRVHHKDGTVATRRIG